MRVRMLYSYMLVALLSLVVAYLAAILFLRLTVTDYMRNSQIADTQPFQAFFQNYYQSNDGWQDVDQVNISQLVTEEIPEEYFLYGLTLVNTNGEILLSENTSQHGMIVTSDTLEVGSPLKVDGNTVAYMFSGSLNDKLLPMFDTEIADRVKVATIRASLLGMLVALVMSLIMTHTVLKPIGVTIDAVKKISKGELGVRVPTKPYRDMAELGKAINDMASDLEKNQRIQKFMLMDIAHDLRTPLSVQKATIEAFEDGVYSFDEDGLALIKLQNRQLVHLVEDLRLLTLTDAGLFEVQKVETELQVFLQAILTSFEGMFGKKGITFNFSISPDEIFVDIDPHLMQRVLENLLQNAFQHSPVNGEIQLKILRKINRVGILIADQGPGIPEKKLETIFNRYYRVRPAGQGTPEGLGLGLTISRRIVQAHGGTLYAQNIPGKGAEFVLELPYSS
ncbi:MAG: HAMP domain-containing protein [Chloroflexi bacterium]|nr:HAMP domain-containing protein [Chloroflexota bacterium]